MVHGGCSSIGCYAMTDAVIDEIWRLVTAALKQGQPRFHVHIFPFRMTEENLARRGQARWAAFWRDLKPGYDAVRGHAAAAQDLRLSTAATPSRRPRPAQTAATDIDATLSRGADAKT